MTHDPHLSEARLKQPQAELARLKLNSFRQRLALLEEQVPGVVADAKRFLALEQVPPWETVLLNPQGELASLADKYDFDFLRRRPDRQQVRPTTDLFFEAIELLYEIWLTEQDASAAPAPDPGQRVR